MTTVGLALAATLSFASPEGDAEAPIIVVTSAPAPAPAPVPPPTMAPQVIVSAAAPAAAPVAVPVASVTPRKPMAGVGLLAVSSTAFMIGLSAQITTAVAQANFCSNWSQQGFNTVHGCFYVTEPWHVHAGTGWAFGASMVMTSIGSGALGQYDAWQTAYGDGRRRNARARVVSGAVLTTLGIGAFIAEGILLQRELNDFCTSHECEVQRRKLYYALADVGALSLNAGFGLMSHGSNYRRNLARYRGLQNWSLAPQASPSMVGANASVRF